MPMAGGLVLLPKNFLFSRLVLRMIELIQIKGGLCFNQSLYTTEKFLLIFGFEKCLQRFCCKID
jgi:hypothetical protein